MYGYYQLYLNPSLYQIQYKKTFLPSDDDMLGIGLSKPVMGKNSKNMLHKRWLIAVYSRYRYSYQL